MHGTWYATDVIVLFCHNDHNHHTNFSLSLYRAAIHACGDCVPLLPDHGIHLWLKPSYRYVICDVMKLHVYCVNPLFVNCCVVVTFTPSPHSLLRFFPLAETNNFRLCCLFTRNHRSSGGGVHHFLFHLGGLLRDLRNGCVLIYVILLCLL